MSPKLQVILGIVAFLAISGLMAYMVLVTGTSGY
jgi:hypothetical protein